MFSMMMIDASTIAPIATAMPPSDMMFAVRCCSTIGMNARSTPIGQRQDGDQRAARVQQEDEDDDADDDHLLDRACA